MSKFLKTILSSLWWVIPIVLGMYLFHDISMKKAYWQGADDTLDSVSTLVNKQIQNDSTTLELTIEVKKKATRVYLTSKSFKYK